MGSANGVITAVISDLLADLCANETPPSAVRSRAFLIGAGDGLLSRVLSDGVPSAL